MSYSLLPWLPVVYCSTATMLNSTCSEITLQLFRQRQPQVAMATSSTLDLFFVASGGLGFIIQFT